MKSNEHIQFQTYNPLYQAIVAIFELNFTLYMKRYKYEYRIIEK